MNLGTCLAHQACAYDGEDKEYIYTSDKQTYLQVLIWKTNGKMEKY
jgi:hypothetical protein